ncbi:type II secretion system minor pseudopilin GspK [Alteromonas oceanisediminis]|uniref:type II secretion system minor pseudopilin GspK n=1 Tax=Alteromonas oceanisediminis TaxID=2836180 RepID=UPI001BDA6416|nr:type II secretion system minor pseudopilin GspK [Alteromonas oceanisediminis]MBT0587859.1 type II secretion system minor pseudopilin GspK [Alteromonas oceanisediminis]
MIIHHRFARHQRGVALLIVLMVVAFVAILGTEMGMRLQLQIQRTANIKDSNQAYWYALGAEQYARKSIKLLLEQADGVIHLNQPWSEQFLYPLDNGGIQADLVDMQSCFNLNAVIPANGNANANGQEQGQSTNPADVEVTPAMEAFHRLLLTQGMIPDMDSFTADTVRDSLADWLDADDNIRAFGAEDVDYESLPHPYLAANAMMQNKSELRMVNGVSAQWINTLFAYVCARPNDASMQLNVNTVSEDQAPVLAALTGLDAGRASALIASRPQDGWQDTQAFFSEPDIQALQLTDAQRQWFTVTTQHFILYTKTRYNNATFSMSSVFYIDDSEKVSVIRREFGGRY